MILSNAKRPKSKSAIRKTACLSLCGRLVSHDFITAIDNKLLSDVNVLPVSESESEPEPEPESFWYALPTKPFEGLESHPLKSQKPRVAVDAIVLPIFDKKSIY